jgi:hypothetical protein
MDILYCTNLILRANWRNTRRDVGPNCLWADSVALPTGIGRLILALAIIAIGAGLLSQAAREYSNPVAAIPPNHLGAVR